MTDAVGREKRKKRARRERRRESAWSHRCGADYGLIGLIRSLIIGGKEEDKERKAESGRKGVSDRKEGRKNGQTEGRNHSMRREIESTRRRGSGGFHAE